MDGNKLEMLTVDQRVQETSPEITKTGTQLNAVQRTKDTVEQRLPRDFLKENGSFQ